MSRSAQQPTASREWWFQCEVCEAVFEPGFLGNACAACGGLLNIEWRSTKLQVDPRERSLWRYASALPVTKPPAHVTMEEGCTPLVQAELAGRRVYLKLDSSLPSGSFKDRGAVVMVEYAMEAGVTDVVIDSSGNAASAVAMYAARAGLSCRVFVPEGNSPGKLVQAAAHRATVVSVPGPRAAATSAAEAAAAAGAFHINHNRSPLFAEGVKTWLLEVLEDTGTTIRHAFMPAGGGSLVAGAMAALRLSNHELRLHAVQPAACAPLAAAFLDGKNVRVQAQPSIAEGTNIEAPPRLEQVVTGVHRSGGSIRAVSEAAIAAATQELWDQGIYAEPTGALGVAGFLEAVQGGAAIDDDETVIMITGHGLKTTSLNSELQRNSALSAA